MLSFTLLAQLLLKQLSCQKTGTVTRKQNVWTEKQGEIVNDSVSKDGGRNFIKNRSFEGKAWKVKSGKKNWRKFSASSHYGNAGLNCCWNATLVVLLTGIFLNLTLYCTVTTSWRRTILADGDMFISDSSGFPSSTIWGWHVVGNCGSDINTIYCWRGNSQAVKRGNLIT